MDLLAVREATTEARNRIRSGNGPVFLEAMTYRFRGHSMADPSSYRDSTEIEEWRDRDPIEIFKTFSLQEGLATPEELSRIDEEVVEVVEEAVRFGEESPEPDIDSMYQNVYA